MFVSLIPRLQIVMGMEMSFSLLLCFCTTSSSLYMDAYCSKVSSIIISLALELHHDLCKPFNMMLSVVCIVCT